MYDDPHCLDDMLTGSCDCRDCSTSQDSGIQDLRGSPDNMGNKRRLQYNPSHYQEEVRLRLRQPCVVGEQVLDVPE